MVLGDGPGGAAGRRWPTLAGGDAAVSGAVSRRPDGAGCSPGRAASGSAWAGSCTARSRCSRGAGRGLRLPGRRAGGQAGFEVPVREVLFAAEGSRRRLCWSRPGTRRPRCSRCRSRWWSCCGRGAWRRMWCWAIRWASSPRRMWRVCSTLADAARLVAARARLMQALPAGGAMAAVEGERGRGLRDSARTAGRAAGGGRGGQRPGVGGGFRRRGRGRAGDGGRVEARGRRVSRLRVSHAFHSPLMEPMLAEFADVAAGVDLPAADAPGRLSTSPAQPVGAEDWATPDYWVRQIREPVRFARRRCATATGEQGVTRLLEIGPDPVLTALAQDRRRTAAAASAAAQGPRRGRVPSWSRGRRAVRTRRAASTGPPCSPGPARQRVDLPTYAFQRQRYWLDAARPATDARGPGPGRGRAPAAGRRGGAGRFGRVLLTGAAVRAVASVAGRPRGGGLGPGARAPRSWSWPYGRATRSAATGSRS